MNRQFPRRAPGPPVVAGYDRSSYALAAVRYAAEEAHQRGAPLLLVHGFTWPWIYPPLLPPVLPPADPPLPLPRDQIAAELDETADQLREEFRHLTVRTAVDDGHGAQVLVDHSQGAALVVVGHRGHGGFAELLVGSVAIHTAAHAHCPVLVVRGIPTKPDGPVVVGIDGSPDGRLATAFAFATATRRGVPVVAVAVGPTDDYDGPVPDRDFLAAALTGHRLAHPEVEVHTEIARAVSPAASLIHAADGAGLVVVGSRGLGGLRGLLLGSVGRALIEHAPCPVAVVRPNT